MAVIKKIGVLSLAKVQALIMAIVGLILGVFMAILGVSIGGAVGYGGIGVGFGVLSIVVMPIVYGVTGFIMGALTALFYNFVADFVGGIEVQTE